MPADYKTWSSRVRELDRGLAALGSMAAGIGVLPPCGQSWYELLRLKLLPQLDIEPLLVVGIVGGTNIGKSLLFNHLAGELASGVSPLAAGTKHPVCLVPAGLDDPAVLARLFDGFELVPWESADDPLQDSPKNLLFWRVGSRRAAAAAPVGRPGRRFRRGGELAAGPGDPPGGRRAGGRPHPAEIQRRGGQAVLPRRGPGRQADRGPVQPGGPGGRPAVLAAMALDFLQPDGRRAGVGLRDPAGPCGGRRAAAAVLPGRAGRPAAAEQPSSLRDELAALHFDEIKIRTFRGALRRVLDAQEGAAGYLDAIRRAAGQFGAAHGVLSAAEMARVSWPSLPPSVLVEEIRRVVGRRPHRVVPVDPRLLPQARPRHRLLLALGHREGHVGQGGPAGLFSPPGAGGHRAGGAENPRGAGPPCPGGQRDPSAPAGSTAQRHRPRASLGARRSRAPGTSGRGRGLPRVSLGGTRCVEAGSGPARSASCNPWTRWRRLPGRPSASSCWSAAGTWPETSWAMPRPRRPARPSTQLAGEAAITGGVAGGGEALLSSAGEGIGQAAARLFTRLQSRYAQQRAAWLAGWLERNSSATS